MKKDKRQERLSALRHQRWQWFWVMVTMIIMGTIFQTCANHKLWPNLTATVAKLCGHGLWISFVVSFFLFGEEDKLTKGFKLYRK